MLHYVSKCYKMSHFLDMGHLCVILKIYFPQISGRFYLGLQYFKELYAIVAGLS